MISEDIVGLHILKDADFDLNPPADLPRYEVRHRLSAAVVGDVGLIRA